MIRRRLPCVRSVIIIVVIIIVVVMIAAAMPAVIFIVIIVVIIIVIIVPGTALSRVVVDDGDLSGVPGNRRPEVAQYFARPGVDDDLALSIPALGKNADPTKQGPLLHDAAKAQLPQLADDAVDNILRGSRRCQRKADRQSR